MDSVGGSLRLKGASVSGGVKKKCVYKFTFLPELRSNTFCCRKKKKKAKEVLEAVERMEEKSYNSSGSGVGGTMTAAELSFKRMQEKRVRGIRSLVKHVSHSLIRGDGWKWSTQ